MPFSKPYNSMPRAGWRLLLSAVVLIVTMTTAAAQLKGDSSSRLVCADGVVCDPHALPGLPNWSWRGTHTFQVENDLFGSSNDRNYTHGMRYAWTSDEHSLPDWWCQLSCRLHFLPNAGAVRTSLALGQSMFTPENIAADTLIPEDRPYAGWFYVTGGFVIEDLNQKDLHTVELTLGIVGPQSYADETQIRWHKLIGSPRPNGWDQQLDNEPGIVIGYERKRRHAWETGFDWIPQFDLTPHGAVNLGNVFTNIAGGLTFRFGNALTNEKGNAIDYGAPRIQPSLSGSGFFRPRPGRFGWYVFAGLEGRVVARNIFLDGNTFTDSHHVNKNTLVGDLQGGLVLTYGEWRLSYTKIYRSQEYEGQDDKDSFGAITLSVRF